MWIPKKLFGLQNFESRLRFCIILYGSCSDIEKFSSVLLIMFGLKIRESRRNQLGKKRLMALSKSYVQEGVSYCFLRITCI